MELQNNTVIHREDCENPRIKEECFEQDDITDAQTAQVQQTDMHFMKCVQSSDVDSKIGIKQETWDPNVESRDIKSNPNQSSICLGTDLIKDDDKIDTNEQDIQDEMSPDNKTYVTCFMEYDKSSDMKTKTGIKEEAYDPNGLSCDIKCDLEQPFTLDVIRFIGTGTLQAVDEMDIKQELSGVEEKSADTLNEDEGSGSRKNEAVEDEPLLESPRFNAEESKFNCQRSGFTTLFANDGNNYSITSGSFNEDLRTIKEDIHQKYSICDMSYTQLSSLKINKLIHEVKKFHKCDVCDKSFTMLGNLKTHKLIHVGKKPHKCDVCDKSFTVLGNMKRHKLIHEGKKPHTCDVCDMHFTVLESLKRHKLIHEGKRPYVCDVCDRSFTHFRNLKRHNMTNGCKKLHKFIPEDKKPHKCDVCDKSFTVLGNLKTHKLIHEGKKPHKCNICDMHFTVLGSLKRHKLIHEGKKLHKCDVCDMRFTILGSLKRHKFIHEGKRPHACDVCDKSFTHLRYLKRHKIIHVR